LPLEGIAVILGIDHVLDMGRTSINLMGNCVATAVVARWEGVFDDNKMLTFGTPEELINGEFAGGLSEFNDEDSLLEAQLA
jgi:proton glutamate symport protein